MLEVTAWAPTRAAAVAFLEAVNIAREDRDRTIVTPGFWTWWEQVDDWHTDPLTQEPKNYPYHIQHVGPDTPPEGAERAVWTDPVETVIAGTGQVVPIADVQITGLEGEWTVVKTPAVVDPQTLQVITPAVLVSGTHWNMRFYGSSEATLRKPEPVGGWLPEHDLFARTYINELVAGRTGVSPSWTTAGDVPPGYEAGQCRAFDPALITTRANVWA